jgi:tRNA uridine 5-carboxymethylaminomethyl modification enzyme
MHQSVEESSCGEHNAFRFEGDAPCGDQSSDLTVFYEQFTYGILPDMKVGLAKEDRYQLVRGKKEAVEQIISFARNYSMKPALINDALEKIGTTPLRQGCKLIEILNRPQVTIENIAEYVPAFQRELEKATSSDQDRKEEILEAAEILIKYQGYIDRERMIAEKLARLESIKIKGKFDYSTIQSLSTEARQKLVKIDPETIAQASRIPGVSPSDINVLLVLSGR